MTPRKRPEPPAPPKLTGDGPQYELRLVVPDRKGWRLEVWQNPSPSTPRLQAPEHLATLAGRALETVEQRVLKRLGRAGIRIGAPRRGEDRRWPLEEDLALHLGLLFRTLAPMRSIDRMRQVSDGIDAMSREELAYWLGLTLHRRYPRRVLAALRMLLTMG